MRARKAVRLAGLALLAAGCAARRGPAPPPPVRPAAAERELLARGRRELRAGRAEAALARAEELRRRHPWWVEAHRLRQEALLDLLHSGPALAEYTELRDRHPERPEPWYLLGRISGPGSRREALFREALRRDPGHPRAMGGLAAELGRRGEFAAAGRLLERARTGDPGEADHFLALAELHLEKAVPDRERASELLVQAVAADPLDIRPLVRLASGFEGPRALLAGLKALAMEPEAPLAAAGLAEHLERGGREARRAARFWLEGLAGGPPRLSGAALVLLARLRAEAGDGPGAVALLREAERRGSRLWTTDRELLAALLCGQGRWREAVASLLAWRPAGIALAGPTAEARLALEGAAAEPPALVVRRLAQAGFPGPARSLASWLQGSGQPLGDALAMVAEAEAAAALEAALGTLLARAEAGTLAKLLDELRGVSQTLLGRDVVGQPNLAGFFGIGQLVDPAGPGLPAFFRERGRLLLLGQRVGRPPEAFTGRLVGVDRQRLLLEGRRVEVWRWLTEGKGLRPTGGLVDAAGLALGRHYVLDLESLRQWAAAWRAKAALGERQGVLEQPLPPAEGPLGLWSPGDLEARLLVLALREEGPPLEERLLEVVAHHELGHLADALLFLPPEARLSRVAGLLLRAGLTAAGVEAELERRAQCYALVRTRWPRLALAQAAAGLPQGGDGGGEAHDRGYARLIWELARRGVERQALAGAANPVAALHRLEPGELSLLAAGAARGSSLPEVVVPP